MKTQRSHITDKGWSYIAALFLVLSLGFNSIEFEINNSSFRFKSRDFSPINFGFHALLISYCIFGKTNPIAEAIGKFLLGAKDSSEE